MVCLIPFTNNGRIDCKEKMKECFCVCACDYLSATYVHFTLVNHIKVVSFIAWRGDRKKKTEELERA